MSRSGSMDGLNQGERHVLAEEQSKLSVQRNDEALLKVCGGVGLEPARRGSSAPDGLAAHLASCPLTAAPLRLSSLQFLRSEHGDHAVGIVLREECKVPPINSPHASHLQPRRLSFTAPASHSQPPRLSFTARTPLIHSPHTSHSQPAHLSHALSPCISFAATCAYTAPPACHAQVFAMQPIFQRFIQLTWYGRSATYQHRVGSWLEDKGLGDGATQRFLIWCVFLPLCCLLSLLCHVIVGPFIFVLIAIWPPINDMRPSVRVGSDVDLTPFQSVMGACYLLDLPCVKFWLSAAFELAIALLFTLLRSDTFGDPVGSLQLGGEDPSPSGERDATIFMWIMLCWTCWYVSFDLP